MTPQADDVFGISSKQEVDGDQAFHLSVRDAAYALQELHNHRDVDNTTPQPTQTWSTGTKRKRMTSTQDSVLQENVRDLLASQPQKENASVMWSDKLVGASAAQTAYPTPYSDVDYPWSHIGAVENDAAVQGAPKRARRSVPDVYQPHLKESYGQHRLIPTM
jgi:hypothetical protein